MNIHQNARLTFARRLEMVQDVIERKLTHTATAAKHDVSVPTVRKWVGRYLTQGEPGLRDASSRPQVSPRSIAPSMALAIVELRRRFLTHARIAQSLGVSASTVGRVLARAGLSHWADLAPSEPSVRYEHAHPGDLLHIDTKKLARIVRVGHRITGDPRDNFKFQPHLLPPAPLDRLPTRERGLLRYLGRHHPARAHRQRLGISL